MKKFMEQTCIFIKNHNRRYGGGMDQLHEKYENLKVYLEISGQCGRGFFKRRGFYIFIKGST